MAHIQNKKQPLTAERLTTIIWIAIFLPFVAGIVVVGVHMWSPDLIPTPSIGVTYAAFTNILFLSIAIATIRRLPSNNSTHSS